MVIMMRVTIQPLLLLLLVTNHPLNDCILLPSRLLLLWDTMWFTRHPLLLLLLLLLLMWVTVQPLLLRFTMWFTRHPLLAYLLIITTQ
jgi:hypothetical protein